MLLCVRILSNALGSLPFQQILSSWRLTLPLDHIHSPIKSLWTSWSVTDHMTKPPSNLSTFHYYVISLATQHETRMTTSSLLASLTAKGHFCSFSSAPTASFHPEQLQHSLHRAISTLPSSHVPCASILITHMIKKTLRFPP